jgi:site-specific DNA-methyltransferase (adenine-specific)
MTPYYDHAGISIYLGDCLQVLEAMALEPIAAVFMDPPYASGARTEAQKPASGAMVRGARFERPIENDQMTTSGFVWLIREVSLAIKPALVPGGSMLSFIDWRQWPNLVGALESCNLRAQTMIVWDKGSFGMGNGFRVQHELILHASSGVPRVFDRATANVIRCARDTTVDHPSPKPIGLCQHLLGVVSDQGDCILDPFMGAGSTLIAAKNGGRRAIGIEIEERYCEIAAKRLAQEVMFA